LFCVEAKNKKANWKETAPKSFRKES